MKKLSLSIPGLVLAVSIMAIGLAGCGGDSDDDGGSGVVQISPDSLRFAAGVTNVVFSAAGGTAPYTWTVSDGTLGSVVGANETAIYTSTTNVGRNFVTVTDSQTNSTSATIDQE